MLVLCKLKGAGTEADPYRCDFPSYQLVRHNVAAGLAIADVKAEDVPADAPTRDVTPLWGGGKTFTVAVVDAGVSAQWRDLVRKRNRETHGTWDPNAAVEP